MRRDLRAAGPLLAGVALVAIGAGAVQAQATFPGQAYNEAEATRGQAAYAETCAACHGADLNAGEFGPALKGSAFAGHWQGQTREALVTFIQTRMPPGAPGSLPSQTYADIAAFILKANGSAPGAPASAAGASAPAPAPARDAAAGRFGPPAPHVDFRDATGQAVVAARKAKLDALTPVTAAMLANPPDGDWLMWRRTYGAQGFSNLAQINKANVGRLQPAWNWSLPQSQNEITPLIHDGVLFVTSGNAVQALDGATGDLLWQYIRPLPDRLNGGRASRPKSIAIFGEKLFVPTADKHLVALNIHTGAVIWDHETVGPAPPGVPDNGTLALSSGPVVAHGKVMVGLSLGITGGLGGAYVLALDVDTGKEVWRFNTVDQRPPGEDTWNGAPIAERFGGGTWTSGSYDPVRNLLFYGVGNTYSAGTLLLPHAVKGASNDALYTDATLALDPDTGKLVWYYQHMQRDVWDMDWVFEQTLATIPVDGKPRDVVFTAGKIAIFDVMDRATGKYLFSRDLGVQNLVTAIDPKTGKKTTSPALEPVSGKTLLLCPSSNGVRNWPSTSYNPKSGILYVPMLISCSDYTWTARKPEEVAKGGIDMTYPPRLRPDSDGNFGRIAAIDLVSGKTLWTRRQRFPIASAALATAGGVLFNGSLDRYFRAFDDATGKVLWETRLAASPNAYPVTYSVKGEQYVAVVTGGGSSVDTSGRFLVPEMENPTQGVTLSVFKLPKAAGAAR